jgi:hypothetical protein
MSRIARTYGFSAVFGYDTEFSKAAAVVLVAAEKAMRKARIQVLSIGGLEFRPLESTNHIARTGAAKSLCGRAVTEAVDDWGSCRGECRRCGRSATNILGVWIEGESP